MKHYGISQYCHGHEYRWIFTEDAIRDAGFQVVNILDLDGEDIHWPIGGSNSSATWMQELKDDDEVKAFLTGEADGPDLEDPMLVDIAEYLLTVDTDYGSCTQDYLDKFGLKAEDLTQYDDCSKRQATAESMIKDLKAAGYEDFDYEKPFYGKNEEMTYSELEELHTQVVGKITV